MNEIINKFFWTRYKITYKLQLRRPGFTNNACGPFAHHRERIQKFKETSHLKNIYKKE